MLNASYRALIEEEVEEDKQALQQALEYRRRRERQQPRRQVTDKDLEAYECYLSTLVKGIQSERQSRKHEMIFVCWMSRRDIIGSSNERGPPAVQFQSVGLTPSESVDPAVNSEGGHRGLLLSFLAGLILFSCERRIQQCPKPRFCLSRE